MNNLVIYGLLVLIALLVLFKARSYFTPGPSPDSSSPGPAGAPGPVAGPPPKYTQTKIINPGQDCNANGDSGWTKIGAVTCAK